MNINDFVRERKGEWNRLERLGDKVRPGKSPDLSRDDLWEFGRLYMAAVSDLALLRSSRLASDPNDGVIGYLNGLTARIHGMIYRKPPFKWASVGEYLRSGFPAAIRTGRLYVALSVSIFLFFGFAGFFLALEQPGFIELLVPEGIITAVEDGRVWFNGLHAVAPQASSWLMTHNISVTFLVVAAGVSFGIGTVFLLSLNGLLLGAVAALCFKHDLSVEFWSFVLPHGSVELSAIIIGGAAGLILGHALIDPGPHRRSEYLAVRGRLTATLAIGCVPMLVLAGVIEAFFSPSPAPASLKLGFAAVLFITLILFLSFSGKRSTAAHAEANRPQRSEYHGDQVRALAPHDSE